MVTQLVEGKKVKAHQYWPDRQGTNLNILIDREGTTININIIIINITRPKPAYGRQGLAGRWAKIQIKRVLFGCSQRLTLRLRRSARI